jgi:hypothetical protein
MNNAFSALTLRCCLPGRTMPALPFFHFAQGCTQHHVCTTLTFHPHHERPSCVLPLGALALHTRLSSKPKSFFLSHSGITHFTTHHTFRIGRLSNTRHTKTPKEHRRRDTRVSAQKLICPHETHNPRPHETHHDTHSAPARPPTASPKPLRRLSDSIGGIGTSRTTSTPGRARWLVRYQAGLIGRGTTVCERWRIEHMRRRLERC